ncbi:MAG: DNA polymerase [Candidatus Thiodiazotropha taylori]|nr:DNA polymerase [Candidatus Thiodiazotropha taylori]
MKGYDGYFLLEYLIDQSMRPDKIIYNGSKIMYMTIEKNLHIKVIDSLNFLPMKLSALPKAFGLKELKKGWFPHYFNTRKNQQYVGPYPEPHFYGCDFMGSGEREECLGWLDSKKGTVFDFRKEMLEYCRSDVDILRQACLKFRELLMSATGEKLTDEQGKVEWIGAVDPFDSVTIASVCMNVYRTKFLEEQWRVKLSGATDWVPAKYIDGRMRVWTDGQWFPEDEVVIKEKEFVSSPIAKIPPGGYKIDQYSKASIQWLEWMSRRVGVKIQHALNGGEVRLPGTKYKLDGFCHATNTAYEYHGCIFHGCLTCLPTDREETKHPLTKQSMSELYALTMKKKTYVESLGMNYVCIWEHEFLKECQTNSELRYFLQGLEVTDRLDPRDSFFGGRTNASQLYYKATESERIKYVDFTSLYPWVNKYCEYPVGHPEVITTDFKDMGEYFGIAKVQILPPRGLYHPVLPLRSNGKLKFPLCRSCAESESQCPCVCPDEDRIMTGTWCTPELQTAVRLGYKITKIYEVYHWQETTKYDPCSGEGGLFSSYINTFLKYKQEASGRPDWIVTPEDTQKYVDRYLEKEGVRLDKHNLQKNPGLRALAKLCLNSFWGKFGQRLNLKQSAFFHETEVDAFFRVLSDPTKDVQNFHIVANDTMQVEWVYKKDCQPEDNKTNVYLATFTTCWARLKLYSVLERLDRKVLYYDTDSIIYVSRPGEYDPPLGDYLGELTNELDTGEYIEEFVSGGPKNYTYRTNRGSETCKVRGFTLHFTNSQLISFQSVKSLVTQTTPVSTISVVNPNKICRDKRKRKLYNREEEKTYQMVYTKRRRLDNYDTEPYGY